MYNLFLAKRQKNADELFNIFRKNFKGDTEQSTALQYNNLKFEPHENIRTFANKLQNIVYKRFPKISQDSVDQILIAKFTDTIPSDFKIHLLSHNKEKFDETVDVLATYQEFKENSDFSVIPQFSFSVLNNINAAENMQLPSKSYVSNMQSDEVFENTTQSQIVDNKSVNNGGVFHFHAKASVKCQWCFRISHTAHQCRTKKSRKSNTPGCIQAACFTK